jgi:hypothetical protein
MYADVPAIHDPEDLEPSRSSVSPALLSVPGDAPTVLAGPVPLTIPCALVTPINAWLLAIDRPDQARALLDPWFRETTRHAKRTREVRVALELGLRLEEYLNHTHPRLQRMPIPTRRGGMRHG